MNLFMHNRKLMYGSSELCALEVANGKEIEKIIIEQGDQPTYWDECLLDDHYYDVPNGYTVEHFADQFKTRWRGFRRIKIAVWKVKVIPKTENMKPEQFRDYILKHMTAEEALLKLLESSVISYENLKFSNNEPVHPEMIIAMAAWDLGWDIAVPKQKDEDQMQGISVGTQEYLNSIFKKD